MNNLPIIADSNASKEFGAFLDTKDHCRGHSITVEESRILGVDCEMVNTDQGKELARVSVVNERFETLLDELVKPDNPVLDYCTTYSGISEASLRDVTTTLADVQKKVLSLMTPDTILVGHSLENDLRVLGIIHRRIIDTSLLYPHPDGLPFKNGLKHLSASVLGQVIQSTEPKMESGSKDTPAAPISAPISGHCSVEDASAALRLVFLKMNEALRERQAGDISIVTPSPPPSNCPHSHPKYEPLWKKLRKWGWNCTYSCAGILPLQPLFANLAQDIPFLLPSCLKPCVAIDFGVGQYGERMLDAVVGKKEDVEASHVCPFWSIKKFELEDSHASSPRFVFPPHDSSSLCSFEKCRRKLLIFSSVLKHHRPSS